MALKKIDSIYLYTDNSDASKKAKSYLDRNKISYTELHYDDAAQHPEVFEPLKTWWPAGVFDVTEFPLVIYTEVYDDSDETPVRFIAGNLNKSNIKELYQLG